MAPGMSPFSPKLSRHCSRCHGPAGPGLSRALRRGSGRARSLPSGGAAGGNVSAAAGVGRTKGEDGTREAAAGTPCAPHRCRSPRAAGGEQVSSAAEQEAVQQNGTATGRQRREAVPG